MTGDSRSVRVAAPCRADLAGGTLDIWPIGILHPGSVTINMAIPIEVELRVDLGGDPGVVKHSTPDDEDRLLGIDDAPFDLTAAIVFHFRPEAGVRVEVIRQAPLRSGIGGSSSYGIALARALTELDGSAPPEADVVARVRDLEAGILGVPTGEQDHWAAVRGGVLALHLEVGGNRLETLDIDQGWLNDRITVYFSGIRHRSGMVNWQVIRRRLDGHAATSKAFDQIAAAARACRSGLLAGDEDEVASAIRQEWKARRRLAPEVSPFELEELVGIARTNGAMAVKGCGAGGGGSILIWHRPGARESIIEALKTESNRGHVLATEAAAQGCRLI